MNTIVILGRLTRDFELRYTQNNTAVASGSVASNRKFGSNEETAFFDLTVWGKSAEAIAEHTHKGDMLHIVGRVITETWEGKDGGKRSKNGVTVTDWTFAQSKGGAQSESRASQGSRVDDGPHEHAAIDSEDIPFTPDGFYGKAWM